MKYCRKCGRELSDEAKFCAGCGTAVVEPAKPENIAAQAVTEQTGIESKSEIADQPEMFQQPNRWQEPVRPVVPFLANPIFLGILFIVSGLLMLLLPTIPIMDMMEINAYGVTYVAGATIVNNVISGLESLMFQAPALIAIVTGIVLVQKRRGAFKLAMLGGIFQLLSAVGSLLIMLMVLVFAPTLVEIYVWDLETVAVGTQLMRSQGMSRFAMVELPLLLLGVTSFVFTLIARSKERKSCSQVTLDLFDKMPRSAVSLIVLIPFVNLFIMSKGFLGTLLTGQYYGTYAMSAFSMATVVIANYTIPVTYLITIVIVYGMLGYKWKKWKMIVPGLSVFLLYGIITTVITLGYGREMLVLMYTPEEIMGYAQSMLTPQILAHALLALALFFWIAASARGCIPAWLQAILASVVVILYIVMEPLFAVGLQLSVTVPAAQYVIYLIILGFSVPLLLACRPKKG